MPLKAQVTEKTETDVTILTDRGEVLHIPTSLIDGGVVVGQTVVVAVTAVGGESAGQTSLAKALLNELLKP